MEDAFVGERYVAGHTGEKYQFRSRTSVSQAVSDSFVNSLVGLPVLDLDSGMGLSAKLRSLGPRR